MSLTPVLCSIRRATPLLHVILLFIAPYEYAMATPNPSTSVEQHATVGRSFDARPPPRPCGDPPCDVNPVSDYCPLNTPWIAICASSLRFSAFDPTFSGMLPELFLGSPHKPREW